MALPVARCTTSASTTTPSTGRIRATHLTHRERISDQPASTAGQSRTSSAAAAAPTNNAWARVSVPK